MACLSAVYLILGQAASNYNVVYDHDHDTSQSHHPTPFPPKPTPKPGRRLLPHPARRRLGEAVQPRRVQRQVVHLGGAQPALRHLRLPGACVLGGLEGWDCWVVGFTLACSCIPYVPGWCMPSTVCSLSSHVRTSKNTQHKTKWLQQVHFFTVQNGKLYGKLNWRITEPDGEFFTRCVCFPLSFYVCICSCPSHPWQGGIRLIGRRPSLN